MDRVTDVEPVDDAPRFMKSDFVVFIGAVVSEVVPPPPPFVSLPPPPPHADKPTKTVKQTAAHILLFIKMPPPLQIGVPYIPGIVGKHWNLSGDLPRYSNKGAQNTSDENPH